MVDHSDQLGLSDQFLQSTSPSSLLNHTTSSGPRSAVFQSNEPNEPIDQMEHFRFFLYEPPCSRSPTSTVLEAYDQVVLIADDTLAVLCGLQCLDTPTCYAFGLDSIRGYCVMFRLGGAKSFYDAGDVGQLDECYFRDLDI